MSGRELSPQGDSVLGHDGVLVRWSHMLTQIIKLGTHGTCSSGCGLYLVLVLFVLFQKTSVPWGNAGK